MGEKRTLMFEVVGDILIVVHLDVPPGDAEWAEFLAAGRALVPRPGMANLVFTDGGGPNFSQRRDAQKALQGRHVPVSIVTDNAFVRLIAAALSTFNRDTRVFPPDRLDEALLHVRAGAKERKTVLRVVDKLRAQLRDQR